MSVTILTYVFIAAATLLHGGLLGRVLSPVSQITQTARHISQGDLTHRISISGSGDELTTMAESFNEMLDSLEASFKREKHFSSDVSHELRTPLTAIIINAEEALSGEKTPDEYVGTLKTILNESKKMNLLISQLLMMARSAAGEHSYVMESLDISMLTEAVIDELSESGACQDIVIHGDIEQDIIMLSNQTLYMRLLINLIDNAVKYGRPGGWVIVRLRKIENTVVLTVADNGIGISEKTLPKIWDRFYKADESEVNSSPGLGLSIVKWIAERHNATVRVESRLGIGSLFEVRFSLSSGDGAGTPGDETPL